MTIEEQPQEEQPQDLAVAAALNATPHGEPYGPEGQHDRPETIIVLLGNPRPVEYHHQVDEDGRQALDENDRPLPLRKIERSDLGERIHVARYPADWSPLEIALNLRATWPHHSDDLPQWVETPQDGNQLAQTIAALFSGPQQLQAPAHVDHATGERRQDVTIESANHRVGVGRPEDWKAGR